MNCDKLRDLSVLKCFKLQGYSHQFEGYNIKQSKFSELKQAMSTLKSKYNMRSNSCVPLINFHVAENSKLCDFSIHFYETHYGHG